MKAHSKKSIAEILAWVCAIIAFTPSIYWLWEAVSNSSQLRDAIVILIAGASAIAIDKRIKFSAPTFNKASVICLACAYGLFFTARFCGIAAAFAILGGLTLAAISLGLASTDKPRFVWSIGLSFYAFTILSLLASVFDFRLRIWSGMAATEILKMLNESTALMLVRGMSEPQIVLQSGGQTFVVAAECNGFGIISSGLVLGIMLASFRKGLCLLSRFTIIILSIVIAFIANALRMACIVLVAPMIDKANYHFMHEAFGYFWFAIALISIFLLPSLFIKKDTNDSKKTQN